MFASVPLMERLFIATGVFTALVGCAIFLVTTFTADPAVSLETTAENGILAARLDHYEWLEHDHSKHDHDEDEIDGNVDLNPSTDNEGFARPASMMPGTPDEGYQRLQIELQIQNTMGPGVDVAPTHFWLQDGDGRQWPGLQGGTFRKTNLRLGQALNTVLAFDVEDSNADADMELVWIWDGEETRFAVTGSDHH